MPKVASDTEVFLSPYWFDSQSQWHFSGHKVRLQAVIIKVSKASSVVCGPTSDFNYGRGR